MTQLGGYPAGRGMGAKGKGYDMEYPMSMKKAAQAHAWEFPGKIIKLGRVKLVADTGDFDDITEVDSTDYAGWLDKMKKSGKHTGPLYDKVLKKAAASGTVEGQPRAYSARITPHLRGAVARELAADKPMMAAAKAAAKHDTVARKMAAHILNRERLERHGQPIPTRTKMGTAASEAPTGRFPSEATTQRLAARPKTQRVAVSLRREKLANA